MYLESRFKDADIPFGKDVEIFNVRSTSLEDVIQIIAKDNKQNILIILTWDFINSKELSMY